MKLLWFTFAIVLFINNLFSGTPLSTIPSQAAKQVYPENEIIISYQRGISLKQRKQIEERYQLSSKLFCEKGNWVSYYTDRRDDIVKLSEELQLNPYIKDAQPNYYFYIIWHPDDPSYPMYQWHFNRINMENAWDIEQGGDSAIIVGVLDSGCAFEDYPVPFYEKDKIDSNTTHYRQLPDYNQAHFIDGFDFINNDEHPNDNHSHGTHVASTIVESTDNGLAVAGIAFQVTVLPVKVVNWAGIGNVDVFALGVYYAVDNGADILNISLAASSNPGSVVKDAIEYAAHHDVLMIAGAGNSGAGSVSYPAKYDEVIAVSATCSSVPDSLAYYSNFGSGIEVSAPGGDLVDRDNNGFPDLVVQQTILPGIFNNGFAKPDSFVLIGYGGTSMATPHVTGVIALMRSYGIPCENIRSVLQQTAIDCGTPGYDTLFGYGRIDAFRALGGEDTLPPEISGTTILEDTYYPGPFAVWSQITDLFGIRDARLWYKVNTLPWKDTIAVQTVYPSLYLFSISEVTPPAVIKYYIEAVDNPGNFATDPDGAPVYYYSFIVLETGIEEMGEKRAFFVKIPTLVTSDILPIKFSHPPISSFNISIYDITGKLVKQTTIGKITGLTYPLNTNSLKNGIFILKLNSEGIQLTSKFVKIE